MICKLTFGSDAEGHAVHISETERGAACGCVCPGCGKPLIARKGEVTEHHFAHADGGDCPYGFINSLYYALREAVSDLGYIALPAYQKNRPVLDRGEHCDNVHTLIKTTRVKSERVEFARKGGDQITGLILYCSGKPLMLRVLAGYSEVRAGLDKIKRAGLPVVEIDLSRDTTLTADLAREYIGSQSKQKYWIYNPLAEKRWEELLSGCDRLKVEGEKELIYTYGCPDRSKRQDDMKCMIRKACASCAFFFGMYGIEDGRYLLCGRGYMIKTHMKKRPGQG